MKSFARQYIEWSVTYAVVLLLAMICVWASTSLAGEQVALPEGARIADGWLAYIQNKLFYEHGYAAILGGLLLSWVLTQLGKHAFPLTWSNPRRVFMTRLVAFVTGFFWTSALWPLTFEVDKLHGQALYAMIISGLAVATIVGGLSPTLYKVVLSQAYKRGWLDEERWSAVTRANVKRKAESTDAQLTENEV